MLPFGLDAHAALVLSFAGCIGAHSHISAQAQHIVNVDASTCVTDPEGQAYFSLYGMVFAFFPDDIDNFRPDARSIMDSPRSPEHWQAYLDHWPLPRNADAPVGSPENPIDCVSCQQFSVANA